MTSKNDVTGDELKTKSTSNLYRSGWDRIFGNKDKQSPERTQSQNKKQDKNQQ